MYYQLRVGGSEAMRFRPLGEKGLCDIVEGATFRSGDDTLHRKKIL